jgi:drug/metabolite transporter (DMT)-like permease
MPDAIFGTLIGAVTGIVAFLLVALFSDRYKSDVIATFTVFNPGLLLAGIFSTLGQICYFVALKYSTVSKIALIASMEVFLTMFLTYVIMRGKVRITRDLLVAAVLGFIGTVFLVAE